MFKITNLFKKFIKKDNSNYNKEDNEIIEYVINNIRDYPHNYTSRWSSDGIINNSITNKKHTVSVMISTGQIFRPMDVPMNKEQKSIMISLVASIIKRDKIDMINGFRRKDPINSVKTVNILSYDGVISNTYSVDSLKISYTEDDTVLNIKLDAN